MCSNWLRMHEQQTGRTLCARKATLHTSPVPAEVTGDVALTLPLLLCCGGHHREMGHINQLPGLLVYSPPTAAPPSAASGIFSSASQYMDPSVRAAAGAAADAAFNSALGAAAAAAVAAAGAAAAAWPAQVAANYLCLLETARVLLAAPHDSSEEQQAQVGVPQFLPCSYSACGSMLVQLAPW
jgi:hypothetical protein